MARSPIICALDTPNLPAAEQLAEQLAEHVAAVKLGLEFFCAHGPNGVGRVAKQGRPVFLDLKFHDIPNTVAGAVRSATGTGCFMMTIHASGGAEMCRAAVEAAAEEADKRRVARPLIVGVTVLTSMDAATLHYQGISGQVEDHVLRLAEVGLTSGLDGLVCSPLEIQSIRKRFGGEPTLVVPGIRPEGSKADDQKRTLTPKEALSLGATYLVVGRPITQASNPADAARTMAESLAA